MDLIYTVYLEEWIMKEYILKNGKKLVIRLAEEKDAEGLLVHINQAGRETDFLGFGKEGYDKDIEDEKKYIKYQYHDKKYPANHHHDVRQYRQQRFF